jgi:hypothetical protein
MHLVGDAGSDNASSNQTGLGIQYALTLLKRQVVQGCVTSGECGSPERGEIYLLLGS